MLDATERKVCCVFFIASQRNEKSVARARCLACAALKERGKGKKEMRRLRIVAGSLIVAALIAGAALGAAAQKEDTKCENDF